jgi:hypothetical protein
LIALGSAATAGIVLFGDLASGGMVPGHGQDEINRSVAMAAIAPIFLVLGFVAAVVGLALLTLKRMK